MNKYLLIIQFFFISLQIIIAQETKPPAAGILFNGLILDSSTATPLSGSQIIINRHFSSLSDADGKFAFSVNRLDTVTFIRLGYKPLTFYVSDTLKGREFIAGIFMDMDTLSISEVIIVPRLANLRSEMFNPRQETSTPMENAKYNLELSAYQGRISQGKLGDPATNYEILRQRQKIDAYEKGGIPSDRIAGISPLLLIPAAYLLLNGLPEKPGPLKPHLTDQEISILHQKYLEKQQKEN